jgi:phospholipase/carboxylesterase
MLHGAGSRGENVLKPLLNLADEVGLILVAPDSRGRTWELILDDYGPDVAFIQSSRRTNFAQFIIVPWRVALRGFSDGQSYALSLTQTTAGWALASDRLARRRPPPSGSPPPAVR